MTIEVLVGSGTSLANRLIAEVRTERAKDAFAPINIVVPSNILAVQLGRQLSLALHGILNVRRLTFVEMVKQLAGPDPMGRSPAGELEMLAAVSRAVQETPGYFSPVAHQTGLLRAILATLRDFENSKLAPQDLEVLAGGLYGDGTAGQRDAERLQTLAILCRRTEDLLQPSFESTSSLFARAEAAAGEALHRLGSDGLIVYGFHDFTELQLDLLGTLAAALPLKIFCADERADHSPYAARTVDLLASRGSQTSTLPTATAPMQALASALFGPGSQPVGKASVSFASAPSQVVEVEHCVRNILQLLEDGASTDQIAVAYRGEDYPALLSQSFLRAGLRLFLVGGEPLSDTRYGKSLTLLLRLVGSDLRRASLIEFATFCPLKPELVSSGEAANWERITRRAAIVRGREQWDVRLQAYCGELRDRISRLEPGDDDNRSRLEALISRTQRLRTFALDLSDTLSSLDRQATWSEHAAALSAALTRYVEPADGDEACIEAIAQLGRLDVLSNLPQEFGSFREALEFQLESTTVQTGRIGRGHIFVGQPRDFRGLAFDHVFVLGLAERSFPAPSRVDSILLEGERRNLSSTGRAIRQASQRLDEERLLFSLLVASSGHVHASFPRFDDSRPRPRYASAFFLGLAEARYGNHFDWKLDGLEHESVPDEQPDRELDPLRAISLSDYDRAVLTAVEKPTYREVHYLEAASPHFGAMRTAYASRNGDKLTPYDGSLAESDNIGLASRRLTDTLLSPTSLEKYATCPQRYFLHYLLGLEEIEDPAAITELSPLDRGTIVHRVLERFYQRLQASGELPMKRDRRFDYLLLLESVTEEEFQQAQRRGVTGAVVSWRSNQRLLKEELARFLDSELQAATVDLVPYKFEYPFGDSPESALSIQVGDQFELRFRGQIDRLDKADGYARVIDYKTGKSKARKAGDEVSFFGGRQLQLPIYLLAAAQSLGLPEESVDANYVHVNRDAGFGWRRLTGASLAERRPSFERILQLIADGMTNGVFVPRTREGPRTPRGDNCKFCDFKMVCSARVGWQEDRKAHDPTLKVLNDLRSIE